MNIGTFIIGKMQELKRIYNRISKQTQNQLQEIFDSYNIDFNNLYNIADNKTKSKINIKIEEWKEKDLLNGYFGGLAKSIYNRTRVKNNEILYLLIYSAYIEEQSKLNNYENQIIKEDVNYYYQEGQNEVLKTQKKDKKSSVIPDAIFLALLNQSVNGFVLEQYIEIMIKYNTEQLYKQAVINIQQQKELRIDSNEFQKIVQRQVNQKVNINNNKISGSMDNRLIGMNNLAKVEGMKKNAGDDIKVRFIAVEDEVTTRMCQSLNGQIFNVNDDNEFTRVYGESQAELRIQKIKVKGLVLGLNLPPISHHFHYCRSYIEYVPSTIKNVEFNLNKKILKNGVFKYNAKGISKIALFQNLINAEKVLKDFPILNNKIKDIKIRNNTDYTMALKPMKNADGFSLYINKDVFKSTKEARQEYKEMLKSNYTPEGTTYKDILIHELGHGVTFEIIKSKYNSNIDLIKKDWNNNITSSEIVEKAFKNMNIIDYNDKIRTLSNLSKYALNNKSETIGEAFIDYYSNKNKCQTVSKEIINIMKGMI